MYYSYDSTYYGFLCCVFESFEYKEKVLRLVPKGHAIEALDLFVPTKEILTDPVKAKRVATGLVKKLGAQQSKDFYRAFLSEDPKAIQASFSILLRLFSNDPKILENFADPDVLYFSQTLKKITRESHRIKAFVRFSKAKDGLYFSLVEPDFNVLPLVVTFFKNRYADQKWLIYDAKRGYGFLYNTQRLEQVELAPVKTEALSEASVVELDNQELHFQELWKQYFKSTNIKQRKNLRLHLKHVPKRYWKYLVEKQT